MDRKQIEDIYPLSPMQQGMLFDTLYLARTGIYIERNALHITGPLDEAAFERAWANVVARHPILRTLFLWENRDTPLQVVRRETTLPIAQLDWRDLPAASHQTRLDRFLDDERQQEFDLKQAPLLRLTLIRLAEEAYYLAIVFHHIIIDRWSIGLLLNDFFSFYRAERIGELLHLPPVRPFGDYIGWLQKQDPTRLETFWREHLAGFTTPTPFNIEIDHAHSGEASYKQAETWLSEGHLARLTAFARQHRLTLNTVVQGAWALLLSQYSGESDVLFGATVAGRPAELVGVEQMVGLFINTLPVRVQVPDTAPLVTWLQELQAHMATLQQVTHTPLVEVQRWSEIAAATPLFESILVFENIPLQALPTDIGLQVAGVGITVRGQMAYPLTVTVNPDDRGQMWLQLTYDQHRFAAPDMQRLTAHLQYVLESIPALGQEPLQAVPLLNQAEQAQLWQKYSGTTQVTPPTEQLIHQLVEQQAARTPDALALATIPPPQRPSFFLEASQEMPQASLSYAELNRQANQWAHYLIQEGVGPEKVVAVQQRRSAAALVSLLAILKAGGVFLPLDPALPKQRAAHILADTQPVLVITDENAAAWQPYINIQPTHDPVRPLTPDNSAYLIYTSGTTGQPKGVLVSHQALVNHAQAIVQVFALTPADRVLQFAALSFDVALEEIFPTWLAGAALLLRPADVPAPDEFNRMIAAADLTVLNLPAPYWHEWVSELARAPYLAAADSLRLVVVGSDKVQAEKVAQWCDLMPERITLLNGYGPTETTITATLYPALTSPHGLAVVPLGRPLPNVTAYVLDKRGRAVPPGIIGELYLGGRGLAQGYLNQPGTSAAAFLPHPFSGNPGERLYRTGDLARWLPDGNLAFVGRTDHQVKIRGFRIELEEIENALTRHDGVRQTVVIADDARQQLIAYILPDDLTLTARTLQSWAENKLPDYMVPNQWLILEQFPLTASGKVDRRALPQPTFDTQVNSYIAPRRAEEETLAAIWAEVLGVTPIGIHDNFFQLGGHSLRATQIVSRVRQQLGWDMPVRALFEAPTIAKLAGRYAPEPLSDEAVMTELLDEVEGLSDQDLDDLAALLDLTETN